MLEKLFLISHADRPALRVGLVIAGTQLPRWCAEIVEHIRASNFATLALVVRVDMPPDKSTARQSGLYAIYERWDRRHSDPLVDPLTIVDCRDLLKDVPTLVTTLPADSSPFEPSDVTAIRQASLDVSIRLNSAAVDVATLPVRYGLWWLTVGDCTEGRQAGFWEVRHGDSLTCAALRAHAPGSATALTLCEAVVATEPGLSQVRNRPRPYWAAGGFVIQKLYELHAYGWAHVEQRAVARPACNRPRSCRPPSNVDMVGWLAPTLGKKVRRRLLRRGERQHWRIALRRGPGSLIDDASRLQEFRWIESPPGRSYADPFLVEQEARTWLFFEDFDYAAGLGRLSVAEVVADGLGDVRPVLSKPYHLSYPQVFRDRDDFFMIPESGNNGTVDLYRCTRFPDEWALEKVLLRDRAVDTTVCTESGRYYFFVTLVEPRGLPTQLWLFSADSLVGDWVAHPANPISTDVRNSRGAGAIFRHQGALIRPSQDGSVRYGRRFTLNRIVMLSPESFAEEPVVTIEPPPTFLGTHSYSYSRAGSLEAIDGNALVPLA